MSDKHSSQSQQKATQEPAAAASDAARQGAERFGAFLSQLGELEARAHERVVEVIRESTRLHTEGLQYTLELSRAGRKFALEAARRTAEMWIPA